MQDDQRGMPCGESCRELAIVNERVNEIKRRLDDVIMPALTEVRLHVEPMKDIVTNYRGWKDQVSSSLVAVEKFIERQDQRADDDIEAKKQIAEVLAARERTYAEKDAERIKAAEERRQKRNRRLTYILPFAIVLFSILANRIWVGAEKAWELVHDVMQLTDEWKHYPVPAHSEFFRNYPPPQDATVTPTHY